MEDVTAEVVAGLMTRSCKKMKEEVDVDEKENLCPNASDPDELNIDSSFLIIIDARPFQPLKDELSDPFALHRDLHNFSLLGSVRVHYPNLLRKRSKGRMTLENVIVDKNTRSLVSEPTAIRQASLPLLPLPTFPESCTNPSSPQSRVIVVYDQNSSCASQLPEDCDAKLALNALKLQCRDDVRVCFLAGGLEGFHRLYPHLCTINGSESANNLWRNKESEAKNRNHAPPISERCNNHVSSLCDEDTSDLPCQLLPWLFLGDQTQASSRSSIERTGVTALLNVAALHVCHPSLPVMSAPVPKLQQHSTWFPFTPKTSKFSTPGDFYIQEASPNFHAKKVPSCFDPSFPGAFKEHRFRQKTRKCFYFKPLPGQSAKGVQSSCSDLTNKLQVLNLPISDNLDTEISLWFDLCNSFIEKIKSEGGRVLVHCQAGISRSATICLAYLLWSQTFKSLNEAFEFVRSRRPVVAPNFNFLRQLEEYEASLLSEEHCHRGFAGGLQTDLRSSGDPRLSSRTEASLGARNIFSFNFEQPLPEETPSCNNSLDQNQGKSSSNVTPFDFQRCLFSGAVDSSVRRVPRDERKLKSCSQRKIMTGCRMFGKIKKHCRENVHDPLSDEDTFVWRESGWTSQESRSCPSAPSRLKYEISFRCKTCTVFLSKLFGVNGASHRAHKSSLPWLRRSQTFLLLRRILRHHHHHRHRYHHRDTQHVHLLQAMARESYPQLVCSRMMGGHDDHPDIHATLKLIFVLIMAVALVFLVERKHLL